MIFGSLGFLVFFLDYLLGKTKVIHWCPLVVRQNDHSQNVLFISDDKLLIK